MVVEASGAFSMFSRARTRKLLISCHGRRCGRCCCCGRRSLLLFSRLLLFFLLLLWWWLLLLLLLPLRLSSLSLFFVVMFLFSCIFLLQHHPCDAGHHCSGVCNMGRAFGSREAPHRTRLPGLHLPVYKGSGHHFLLTDTARLPQALMLNSSCPG